MPKYKPACLHQADRRADSLDRYLARLLCRRRGLLQPPLGNQVNCGMAHLCCRHFQPRPSSWPRVGRPRQRPKQHLRRRDLSRLCLHILPRQQGWRRVLAKMSLTTSAWSRHAREYIHTLDHNHRRACSRAEDSPSPWRSNLPGSCHSKGRHPGLGHSTAQKAGRRGTRCQSGQGTMPRARNRRIVRPATLRVDYIYWYRCRREPGSQWDCTDMRSDRRSAHQDRKCNNAR
jgi:hypothetical protein